MSIWICLYYAVRYGIIRKCQEYLNSLKMSGIGGNFIQVCSNCLNLFKLIQNCPNLSKHVQTCPDLFKLFHVGPNYNRTIRNQTIFEILTLLCWIIVLHIFLIFDLFSILHALLGTACLLILLKNSYLYVYLELNIHCFRGKFVNST